MKLETIEYFDNDQKLIGQLIYDESHAEKKSTIIIFPAFEGIAEFAIDYGYRLAKSGYTAFVADIYGDAASSDTIEGCFALITPFLEDRALVRRRSILAYQAASGCKQVDANKVGAIGFCFGGMCGLELARSGANLKAIVSIHGGLQKSDLVTENVNANILILHGHKDPQVPSECLVGFADEMDNAGVDWVFTFFGSAMHSFTDPKTGSFEPAKEKEMGRVYDKTAAERSYRYALDFFEETFN